MLGGSKPLSIVFFGTAELACPSLASLAASSSFKILGLVTQPDAPKGRKLNLQSPPAKIEAARWKLPVWQPAKARAPDFLELLAQSQPDLIVVVAYGQILPPAILSLPHLGCLNVHASLLPKYRGAAPIQWAILNEETETGVTIMNMDAGLDTGPILAQRSTAILPADNAKTLHDRLARIGAELLTETIPLWAAGKSAPRAQPAEGASYARKISKEDGRIDWSQPARVLRNRLRAFTPWPGAFTSLEIDGRAKLLKIWEAEVCENGGAHPGEIIRCNHGEIVVKCGEKALQILSLQIEGGRRLSAPEFLTGHPLNVRQKLG